MKELLNPWIFSCSPYIFSKETLFSSQNMNLLHYLELSNNESRYRKGLLNDVYTDCVGSSSWIHKLAGIATASPDEDMTSTFELNPLHCSQLFGMTRQSWWHSFPTLLRRAFKISSSLLCLKDGCVKFREEISGFMFISKALNWDSKRLSNPNEVTKICARKKLELYLPSSDLEPFEVKLWICWSYWHIYIHKGNLYESMQSQQYRLCMIM